MISKYKSWSVFVVLPSLSFVCRFYQNQSQNAVKESPISFTTWMGFAFPLSLLTLVLSWVWLQVFFLRCRYMHSAGQPSARERESNSVSIRSMCRRCDLRSCHILSLRFGHGTISTTILTLPLIQFSSPRVVI